jgi:hypothetical protein
MWHLLLGHKEDQSLKGKRFGRVRGISNLLLELEFLRKVEAGWYHPPWVVTIAMEPAFWSKKL